MPKKLDVDKDDEEVVIKYLNQATGKNFKLIENNLILVRRVLNDGFTVEDCFKVIDNRVGHWKDDPTMDLYLRPVTLFRKCNFEGYLNAMPFKEKAKPLWTEDQWKDSLKEFIESEKSR